MFYNKKWIFFHPEDTEETQTREMSFKGILVMAQSIQVSLLQRSLKTSTKVSEKGLWLRQKPCECWPARVLYDTVETAH